MEEFTEHKVSLILAPISYDYQDGDIVYRIFVNNQLFVERSFPCLENNKGLSENLIFKTKNYNKTIIQLINIGKKKVKCSKIISNNVRNSIDQSTYLVFIKQKNLDLQIQFIK